MPEQKQILRISSTDNIRYSVLRLLHECLATAARESAGYQIAVSIAQHMSDKQDRGRCELTTQDTMWIAGAIASVGLVLYSMRYELWKMRLAALAFDLLVYTIMMHVMQTLLGLSV
ncbi:hypothetical protein [Agathobaculum sp.]|uniref:hypothetical protein n=1 Tax=Agathobaculum sp. TaxID=2048138 RepID=UPI0011C21945|nr:MAG TPA: hypothetical protein [Caudoviricetes sp.]